MSTESTAMAVAGVLNEARETRPFSWSVRRELWENRSLFVAPSIVALVELFGFGLSIIGLAERRRSALLLDPAHRRVAIELPYDIAAVMLMMTAFIIGLFYSLDALHGERRDRSVLFWKSLPVSDAITVLSKASIPFVILPMITLVVTVATHFVMLLMSSIVLLPSGLAGTTWTNFNLPQSVLVLAYGLIVTVLWHAPIYGWALLISGLARRATFLWAVLPPLAIGIFEKITFNTTYFGAMLKHRLLGNGETAFHFSEAGGIAINSLAQLTPGRYLSTPGVWIGLVVAALFLAGAVRLRRYGGPI